MTVKEITQIKSLQVATENKIKRLLQQQKARREIKIISTLTVLQSNEKCD